MICFGTVFNLLLLGSGAPFAFGFCRPLLSLKSPLAVASRAEDGEGFDFGFEADTGCWNADPDFAPLLRLDRFEPGVDALAHGFCWLVRNLDTCTLGAPSPGLGDTAGDLEGDPGDLNGDGRQGERRAIPELANGILGPEPTGLNGGHEGRGVVAADAGPGVPLRPTGLTGLCGPLSLGGQAGPIGPGGLDGPCRRILSLKTICCSKLHLGWHNWKVSPAHLGQNCSGVNLHCGGPTLNRVANKIVIDWQALKSIFLWLGTVTLDFL